MAEWQPIPLGKESYQPRSGTQSVERLQNLYVEPSKPGAKTPYMLLGTPGLVEWASIGSGPIRGIHYAYGYAWVVSGTELYAVNASTAVATLVGTVAGSAPVRMIHNNTHVAIATATFTYAATLTSIVTLPETGLCAAIYQDGYGLFPQRNTQFLWATPTDDLTTISGTSFTSADAQPDLVIGGISNRREVFVAKERTGEFYQNTGATFPFERTGFMERGCLSPGSIAASDAFYFLGDDKRVYKALGATPQVVSPPEIDRLIDATASPETSEAFVYSQGGQTFYCLNFSDLSIVYSITTGKWHERKSYGLDRWRVQGCAQVSPSLILVGNYDGPEVYQLSLTAYDEDGEPLVREVIDPPLSDDPKPITIHEYHHDMEMGVGLVSGQGSDPVMLFSWSDDDGRTWSNDIELPLGAQGQYRKRASVTRLGRSYNRSHRTRISDPVKTVFLGRSARISQAVA